MRRSDKELTDRKEIDDVLERARVCHLAMCRDGIPYVVPLNYGYAGNCLYFHSSGVGKKIDILRSNSTVSFTAYVDEELKKSGAACDWGTTYKSVIGQGRACFVEGKEEKEKALRIIMRHYSGSEFTFDPARVEKVVIIKVEISEITGKRSA